MNATSAEQSSAVINRTNWLQRFDDVRRFSESICKTLTPEDCVIQSMPDASPIRWHLAHTTWFFETFVLGPDETYRPFNDRFAYLFNSYYNALGEQFPRPDRGLLSRPGVEEIYKYRRHVDRCMRELIADLEPDSALFKVIEIGLNHEQQHQELMLTDVKHLFSRNPLFPGLQEVEFPSGNAARDASWSHFEEGLYEFGFDEGGFAFDNESPRHKQFVPGFKICSNLATNGEYLEFLEAGGYARPEYWLSEGWATVGNAGWRAPLYWHRQDSEWFEFTLAGLVPLDLSRPVCHVSYFEADAFARWCECRLPTEFEWELAASAQAVGDFPSSIFADDLMANDLPIHPVVEQTSEDTGNSQMGNLWQWTASQYLPYPGYKAPPGAIGEYNGKFMCNQFVLRGGSCATSRDHIRVTYRNFFPPDARWQFSGIRLAR